MNMKSLSDIAHQSIVRAGARQVVANSDQVMVGVEQKESLSNHVFKVLTGYYGKKFLAEHCSGQVFIPGEHVPHGDPRANQDRGLMRARSVWGQSLVRYSLQTIADALERCKREHVTWPPTLPEFVALCEACKPRAAARPMTEDELAQARQQEADQKTARQEMRQREGLQRSAARGNPRAARALVKEALPADPVAVLQEAMAAALAAHGMDEGKALRLVEEKFTSELIASWAKGDWRVP